MLKYHVHLYAVVRVLVREVEADSQEEACKKAEEMVDLNQLFDQVHFNPPVAEVAYADGLDGFLVDEDRDTEHKRSIGYDYNYRPY